MANISISIDGIDQVISALDYRPGSVKHKLVTSIRAFYSSQESLTDIERIPTDRLIQSIWEISDDPIKIKSKRRNYFSVKSAVVADLERLSQKGLNPENIIITDLNLFDMSDEAKSNLLSSFADAVKTGDIDLAQAADLLKAVTDFLDGVKVDENESDLQDIAGLIKKALKKISNDGIYDDTELSGGPDESGEVAGPGDRSGGQDSGEETSYDQTADAEQPEDEDIEEIELAEDEELEEIDDAEIGGPELGTEEPAFEEIEDEEALDDDDLEEVEVEDDEEFEAVDQAGADAPDELVGSDDGSGGPDIGGEDIYEQAEDTEPPEDEDIEEIEPAEDEELEEIDDAEIGGPELRTEEPAFEEIEDEEAFDDDDLEEVEVEDDEEFEAVDQAGAGGPDELVGSDDGSGGPDIGGEDIYEQAEDTEPPEDECIEEIELAEDEELEEIDDAEIGGPEQGVEDAASLEDEDIEEIELEEDEELEDVEILDEEELEALEAFRENRTLAEQFDQILGEREKKYNQYAIIPEGRYTVGTKKNLKSSLELQPFDMPRVYIGVYPVTNSLFEVFIEATGYVTTAEKKGFGRVFTSRFKQTKNETVWSKNAGSSDVEGACWYQPSGPGSTLLGKRNHPVVQISVEDALAFASWIGRRIPTEAEWESAARTDLGNKYPWGNEFNIKALNIESSGVGGTTAVDQFDSFVNEFKIIDMLGNIMEWTSDIDTPQVRAKQRMKYSVAKGGAWNGKKDVSISSRGLFKPGFSSNTIGFRCISEMFQ